MLSNMERYADGLAVFIAQCNFDIHLAAFHILAKNPHLPLFV